MKRLIDFHWPGNVRELENIVQRAVTLSTGPVLDLADIHFDYPAARSLNSSAPVLPEGMTLERWEDEIIGEALRRANGNKSQAARSLGLSRNALRYRLTKIGVPDSEDADTPDEIKDGSPGRPDSSS
jgi:DNA-binding NtrC family response regulator